MSVSGWWGSGFFFSEAKPKALPRLLIIRGVKSLKLQEMDGQPEYKPTLAVKYHSKVLRPSTSKGRHYFLQSPTWRNASKRCHGRRSHSAHSKAPTRLARQSTRYHYADAQGSQWPNTIAKEVVSKLADHNQLSIPLQMWSENWHLKRRCALIPAPT